MVEEQGARLGIAPTCAALGLARATFYRQRRRPVAGAIVPRVRRAPRQALAPTERKDRDFEGTGIERMTTAELLSTFFGPSGRSP